MHSTRPYHRPVHDHRQQASAAKQLTPRDSPGLLFATDGMSREVEIILVVIGAVLSLTAIAVFIGIYVNKRANMTLQQRISSLKQEIQDHDLENGTGTTTPRGPVHSVDGVVEQRVSRPLSETSNLPGSNAVATERGFVGRELKAYKKQRQERKRLPVELRSSMNVELPINMVQLRGKGVATTSLAATSVPSKNQGVTNAAKDVSSSTNAYSTV